MKTITGAKNEILQQFGYKLDSNKDGSLHRVYYVEEPDAYSICGDDAEELVNEAYEYLLFEVSQGMYQFPEFN